MVENTVENNGSENNTAINITYETIFELLRREKNRDELQKLNENFYEDIQSYLEEKNNVFSPHNKDMFSEPEREKTQKQVLNTKRMITELFERREKKIIILALNKVRTSSSIIDLSAMLSDEKEFFYKITGVLSEYRDYSLKKMMNDFKTEKPQIIAETKPLLTKPVLNEEKKELNQSKKVETISNSSKKDKKTLRILSKVPKFMGKELEVYGPFNPDDMASLPCEIADVLIKKGRAEEINTD